MSIGPEKPTDQGNGRPIRSPIEPDGTPEEPNDPYTSFRQELAQEGPLLTITGKTLRLTNHAIDKLRQGGFTGDQLRAAVRHGITAVVNYQGRSQSVYYNVQARMYVAVVEDRIVTIIKMDARRAAKKGLPVR